MKVYRLDTNYSNYLNHFEPKISINKNGKENRPFLGVVLTVHNINFFAPLTSPKAKHLTMKNTQDFLKIDDGFLGGINLNNMIPIPRIALQEINISQIQDIKYRQMLYKQLNWVKNNQERINNRAKNLYYLVIQKKATNDLIERCCNFRLLEEKCQEFIESRKIS